MPNKKRKDNLWTTYFILSIGLGSCFGLLMNHLAIGSLAGLIVGVHLGNREAKKLK